EVQKKNLLDDNEALVQFAAMQDDLFVWVVTKKEARLKHLNISVRDLAAGVFVLRCGLDSEEWATATKSRWCGDLLGLKTKANPLQPLPFDLGKAHELYQALFGQVEDMIKGKRLLIVPSGPLTSLPFQVLVTKKPETPLPATPVGYRNVAWLGRSNAISVLPAVSSLKALREQAAKGKQAPLDYVGYGDPVLKGIKDCPLPKVPEACPGIKKQARVEVALADQPSFPLARRSVPSVNTVFARGPTAEAVLEGVRGLCPLPDTAYEIKCVADRFKGGSKVIRLGKDATKADIKDLSEKGDLARYRIVHFATHGLVSGDFEQMGKRQAQPAHVLTPPDKRHDDDDTGLLLASDVAQLKLNADWVVLSACNTASGEKLGAEALSGLARAFFYAGAKSLLVSHWPVYSEAAVQLTTRAFAELDENKTVGRAEALQASLIALMDDVDPKNAHPSRWAPFSLVGEGRR